MALVDYASSDEGSENEADVDEKATISVSSDSRSGNTKLSENVNIDDDGELFSSLPKPKKTFSFLDDENKLSKLLLNKSSLTLRKKENVKIAVPSVSEYEEDSEQPAPKKLKASIKGAGLFSVLPPPKNTVKQTNKIFVPHVLSKTQVKKTVNKTQTVHKNGNNMPVKGVDVEDEEEEDDTPVGSSFFGNILTQESSPSSSEHITIENTVTAENVADFAVHGTSFVTGPELQKEPTHLNLTVNVNEDNYNNPNDGTETMEVVSAADNPLDLDEKALQMLCGNKKKRHQMPMNIIDLSSDEVLPDSKEWLLKQFTEEKRGRGHSHKKSGGFSSQSRRKHQITYLAYQAKEQELELQNQWANNRMSRKQTQSKYGF